MPHRHGLDPGESSLCRALCRAEQLLEAAATRTLCRREHAADRTQPTVQPQLADRRMAGQPLRRDLASRSQYGQRNRKVEPRTLFAQLGRREIDGDPAHRPLQGGRPDPAAHAFLRLLAGAIGEADDRELGNAALEMSLDVDAPSFEADQGVSNRSCEHVVNVDNNL